MRTETEQTARNRVSRFLNMNVNTNTNDTQNPNGFDFVPKPEQNEKWHLENKCLFHNQQFLEGEKCETGRKCWTSNPMACEFCAHHTEDKLKSKVDGTALNRKSGEWKCDEELIKPPLGCIIQESSTSEWRSRNPYSISDFGRGKRWCRHNVTSGDNLSATYLRDLRTIDSRYKDPLNDDTDKNFLCNFREYLVNYQESCGVPRSEYSFSALISTMGRATGRSLLALLYVILNIIPVVEVFLHLVRFVLDKVISIRNSKDFRQTMIRCFVFTTELFSVYICLIFIFGFIILPIVHMAVDIVAKIMLYN